MTVLVALLFAGLVSIAFAEDESPIIDQHTCSHPSLSCPEHLPQNIDSCCLNYPSGHFLLTQFWDTNPALGDSKSWTIHGLWPDLCSGGFDQFCDSSREYSNISAILEETSATPDLIDFMKAKWLSINGDNNHLWAHEWNKHGTCISTIEPACYSSNTSTYNAMVDYFNHATNLYSTLNTYQALAEHDIIPSYHRTYALTDLQSAIASTHENYEVTFRCRGRELDEIWYHFTVRGSLRNAPPFNSSLSILEAKNAIQQIFVPAAPDGVKSNCPPHGIKYLPKDPDRPAPTPTSVPSTSTHTQPTPTSTLSPFSGWGHLVVHVVKDDTSSSYHAIGRTTESDYTGCLIRGGKWYHTRGSSCATYIAKQDAGHLLSTTSSDLDLKLTDHLSVQHPFTPSFPKENLELRSIPSPENQSPENGDEGEHFFTLSSLYSPCAILPATGQFSCASDLGIQSIFSYKNISSSSSSSSSRVVLAYTLDEEERTTFYAAGIPQKFEKIDLYTTPGVGGDDGDDDERRKVEVEIEWQAL